jgi:hypothetical protein
VRHLHQYLTQDIRPRVQQAANGMTEPFYEMLLRTLAWLSTLADLISKRLLAVRYWHLEFEMTAGDLHGPWHYLGGEVELLFDGHEPLRITWAENAGWAEHFSVQVVRSSKFVPDALVQLDASSSAVWEPVIGKAVDTVEVFGFNDTPAVVLLQFNPGAVLVGVGYGSRSRKLLYGDGDSSRLPREPRPSG